MVRFHETSCCVLSGSFSFLSSVHSQFLIWVTDSHTTQARHGYRTLRLHERPSLWTLLSKMGWEAATCRGVAHWLSLQGIHPLYWEKWVKSYVWLFLSWNVIFSPQTLEFLILGSSDSHWIIPWFSWCSSTQGADDGTSQSQYLLSVQYFYPKVVKYMSFFMCNWNFLQDRSYLRSQNKS